MIALVYPHVVPHTPQFTRLFKGVSHPFDGLASQFPNPELHDVNKHVPDEQSDAPATWEHAVPHTPQLDSVFKGDSHPFDAIPSQLSHPELHDVT